MSFVFVFFFSSFFLLYYRKTEEKQYMLLFSSIDPDVDEGVYLITGGNG